MQASSIARRAWSVRARLLFLVFAVWLPAAVALALLAHANYEREEAAARRHIQDLGDSLNNAIQRELDNAGIMARALAASSALRDGDIARFQEEARAAVAGTHLWVVLLDPQRQIANTRLPSPQVLPRVAGAPFVAGPGTEIHFVERGALSQAPVIRVLAPELGVRPPRYNVAVSLDPAVIQAMLMGPVYPVGSLAAVVDRDHRVMARTRDPQKWLGAEATGDVRRRLVAGESGFAPSVTLDGVPSLTYLSRRSDHGWSVVMALPLATLTESARRLTLHATAASALLLLIGLGVALYASRRIAGAVSALERAAAELGRNEVPALPATGVAETDAVGRAMHEAGARLQASGRVLQDKVQEAVRAAERAQARLLDAQKHEAIGRLTGGLAHDFNNLLQTIAIGLQLVERSAPEGRHSRPLKAAIDACGRAANLVKQMLAFGRAQPLRPEPIVLADFVLKGQELTHKAVGERIALEVALEPDVPPVFADAAQLELALLNLVFNARDAMPQGGRIVLSARRALRDETQDLPQGDYVCLAVADQGTGMDAATQARVFDPYFTTKPPGAGSGLGLPQVRAFARQSGGDVRLASEPGAGTCVTLLLPVSTVAPAASQAGPAERPAARPLRVLMVEDDLLVSSVVVPALQAEGHEVRLCRSADEALAMLAGPEAFDVLFTDVVMPGSMSGADLAHWCREHRPALPVVLATGYSAQEIPEGVRVLRKPYGVDAVLAQLQAAVGSAPLVLG